MNIIDNLILISIFIFFPLNIYLIYASNMSYLNVKNKKIILESALLSSFFLIIKFIKVNNIYLILYLNIPLIVCYIKKLKLSKIIISILLILTYNEILNINILILIPEYLLYYILINTVIKKGESKVKENIIINIFVLIKAIFTIIYIVIITDRKYVFENVIYLVLVLILFVTYIYICNSIFKKFEDILNLNNIISENKKQKILYEALSKLTHELKNPISVCKGYLEILNKNDNKNIDKYIPIISNEIDRTLSVINDFSNLRKTNNISTEELDLEILFNDIIENMNPLFAKNNSNIILNMKKDISIEADYNRLKQMVINILKNSLEAKKKDVPLEVIIDITKYNNKVKIIIQDNGIGMKKETLENIGNIFYTTKETGNGLGVVLINEIVKMHNGIIKYNSKEDIGTKINISLPIKKVC